MLKKIFVSIFLSSFVLSAFVSMDISDKVVKNKIEYYSNNKFKIKSIDVIEEGVHTLFYIYHLEPKGFVIVSGDDRSLPVLGYSFQNEFLMDNMPTNISWLLNSYKEQILQLIDSDAIQELDVSLDWDRYLSNNHSDNDFRNVSPLLDAEFDQSGGWNNTLTAETGFNGPLGCVAISMGQIMHYWGYPEQGEGSNYYYEDDLGNLEADFGQTFYDFDNMAATYATNPSRLLLYHCGIAVNMDYEYGGSGAQCQGVYPSAEYAMENFFKYGNSIQSVDADNYDNISEFRNILKNELDLSKPILFSGFSDSYGNGGHAWNIDGYQGNSLHCKWGWGGYNNGYFSLPSLNGFDTWQNALINIIPETYESPLALFEYEVNDMDVFFIDLSEVVNESEIETWSWDFGDGVSESNPNGFATHTYTNPGDYIVSLSVTNIYGQTGDIHTEFITIGNLMLGDINEDSLLNILDIVMMVNFVLGSDNPTNSEFNASDMNDDGVLNVLDIVVLLNLILN